MNEKIRQSDPGAELEALTNSLMQSYEELALLHRISDRMRVNQNPVDFLNRLGPDVREVIEAEQLLVFWCRKVLQPWELPAVIAAGDMDLENMHLEVIWDRCRQQVSQPNSILNDSNVDRPYRFAWPNPIRNIVGVPIHRQKQLLGALVGLNKTGKADFDSIDTKLLISVANEIAVFLENYRLYQDLQELFLGSLRALTSSVDAKDPYTCGHSERVSLIARYLAEQLKLDEENVNGIYLAGLLHDVGKIGIDEAVLSKPGRLSDNEFDQIKKHPRIGAEILRPIRQMEQVTQAVLSHHERYDGFGYPEGLSGNHIPLAGRIIMLADSFDAMISNRTYRGALPVGAALAEIRRFSGTQFDPELSDVFLGSDISSLLEQLDTINTKSFPVGVGQSFNKLFIPTLN